MMRRILLLPGDAQRAQRLRAMLAAVPLTVEVCERAVDVSERLRGCDAELLLMDFDAMSGAVAVIRALRSGEVPDDIPILVIDRASDAQIQTAMRSAGADDCLCEPVDPAALQAGIERLIAQRTERRRADTRARALVLLGRFLRVETRWLKPPAGQELSTFVDGASLTALLWCVS